jgi:hypothetical protein
MKNKIESRGSEDSRRGFFRRCLGAGAVLAAAPPGGRVAAARHLNQIGAECLEKRTR